MKKRYFLLPIVIISLMVLVIDSNKDVINKEVVLDNAEISYPFFGEWKIDNYIDSYLNDYKSSDDKVLIDYDYYKESGNYYVTFYTYVFDGNMMSEETYSLVIDTANEEVKRGSGDYMKYDFVNYKKRNDSKKMVALTFDDGPNYNTNKVIDTLNKYGVKATFFVLGTKIKGNEYILKKMSDSGMEIGNHTFNHLLLTKYKEEKIKEEIDSTSNLIFETVGKRPRLLRPSYGAFNKRVKDASNSPIIIWDIDTLDWKRHNSKKIASRVLNRVHDGDIVLMHDIYSATANALDIIIPELLERGFDIVTVPELFYYKEISLEKGKAYGKAR